MLVTYCWLTQCPKTFGPHYLAASVGQESVGPRWVVPGVLLTQAPVKVLVRLGRDRVQQKSAVVCLSSSLAGGRRLPSVPSHVGLSVMAIGWRWRGQVRKKMGERGSVHEQERERASHLEGQSSVTLSPE